MKALECARALVSLKELGFIHSDLLSPFCSADVWLDL